MSFLKLSKESDKVLSDDGKVLSTEHMFQGEPFAVYSADDNSLTFYADNLLPEEGTEYHNKTATNVYTDFIDKDFSSASSVPWYSIRSNVKSVIVDDSFGRARPISLAFWFYYFTNCHSFDLAYLHTSQVTSMSQTFHYAGMENIDASMFNTDNVENFQGMFEECVNLLSVDISTFNSSKATDARSMFAYDTELTTIYSDDKSFKGDDIKTTLTMFSLCRNLVGGNGTVYDPNKTNGSMAHVDTPDNPGYFTAKGD